MPEETFKNKLAFLTFLEEKRVLLEYLMNLSNNSTALSLQYLFEVVPPDAWLDEAFYWHDTPEGDSFWNMIDDKWQQKILEL